MAPALLALSLAACESPTSAREADRLTVDVVDVQIVPASVAASAQVNVAVSGYLRDGCETLGATSQSRSGNTITVTIATDRGSTDRACIQVISPVAQTVSLEGTFPSGTYVLRVNGVERTFRID